MNQPSSSLKLVVGLLLLIASGGLNNSANSQDSSEKVAPNAVVPAPPTTELSPASTEPTTAKDAVAKMEAKSEEKELSLLEIFPVQEPLSYKNGKPNTSAPDEATIAAKAAAGEVWVNSNSKVFHKPNTTYYGKTKKGFFLPEAEALEKGYRGVAGQ